VKYCARELTDNCQFCLALTTQKRKFNEKNQNELIGYDANFTVIVEVTEFTFDDVGYCNETTLVMSYSTLNLYTHVYFVTHIKKTLNILELYGK